jgi:glycosyltransferase involved in cell wall biosynthesis
MRITIVTPSFNQAPFLEEALLSVKNQHYDDLEHIVIDGGSTDGSVEILQDYSSRPGWTHLLWVSEPDKGQSDALNKGFRLATGDLIGWLNSDDRYHPNCCSRVVAECRNNSTVDVFYGDYVIIDHNGNAVEVRREIEYNPFVLKYHRVLYIPTTTSFFRRRVFEEGNFLDLSFHYAMDYEFFLRLSAHGYRFKHIAHFMADFRVHDRAKSKVELKRQLAEHDAIALANVSVLNNVSPVLTRFLFCMLRIVAGLVRWSEKLLRGYYFEQYQLITKPSVKGELL